MLTRELEVPEGAPTRSTPASADRRTRWPAASRRSTCSCPGAGRARERRPGAPAGAAEADVPGPGHLDQLTGLLNRRGLVLTAEQLPGHLGVLFCDLDGFKGVNDTRPRRGRRAGEGGPPAGGPHAEDSVLGRMGGDEFRRRPRGLGRRPGRPRPPHRIDLGRPFLLEAGMARIGVSIGAAHAAPGERDSDSLLGQADQLMYEVKRSRKAGRPRASCSSPAESQR